MTRWQSEQVATHNRGQIDYYATPDRKPRMYPNRTPYVVRQVDHLLRFAGLTPGTRVLEVGCGMGRFTFLLRDRGVAVEGLDLSPDLVARFREFDAGRGTPVHVGDIAAPPPGLEGRFDAIVGFMTLHHMHDLAACMASVAKLLVPGGRAAFLEPNPYNPLYYIQITATPGMSWRAEGGLLRMRAAVLRQAMSSAGLVDFRVERFGFFPSFVTNRPVGAAVEDALERAPLLGPVRPFQLFGASRPLV